MKEQFENWVTGQDDVQEWDTLSGTEMMRLAWNAAVEAAAHECKEYAHSGVNVYRRQVAYACQRRVKALAANAQDSRQRGARH